MKALVTGGAGFIGHHLVAALVRRGDEVHVIDDLATGDSTRLDAVVHQIEFVEGSILDRAQLARAMTGCEVVFHEAAIPSVSRSVVDPRRTNEVNVSGTIEVMLAAAEHGVQRVILAASSSVYGASPTLPCRESQPPDPLSPYATSKLAAEHYLHSLGNLHGIATIALRYFNVFGPGQDPRSEYAAVVPRFITAALDGQRPTVNGSLEISRDFTFIDNVVGANLLAASEAAPSGLTCNIACGTRFSLGDLLEAIGAALGEKIDPILATARQGDVPHSLADIGLAASELGYEVAVPFPEGIRRTVEWYRGRRADGGQSADAAPSAH